jgi:hypothetical protein
LAVIIEATQSCTDSQVTRSPAASLVRICPAAALTLTAAVRVWFAVPDVVRSTVVESTAVSGVSAAPPAAEMTHGFDVDPVPVTVTPLPAVRLHEQAD